ncbi:MAG: YgaP family membrane protein [Nitrospirota bacterium]
MLYIAKTDSWYLERIIWLIAGVFTLASAILAWVHSPYWLILTALVGINLLIFALTGFCLMANILYKLGAKPRLQK